MTMNQVSEYIDLPVDVSSDLEFIKSCKNSKTSCCWSFGEKIGDTGFRVVAFNRPYTFVMSDAAHQKVL